MSTINATLTFSLPEDTEANLINLYTATGENSSYTLATQIPYDYGQNILEIDLDDTTWYKIQFLNSTNARTSPLSGGVYGGNFSFGAPFLAVSTTTDGANYATSQDVYDYSDLTAQEVSAKKVSTALKRARSSIDFRTSEMGLDRFDMFSSDVARRKYNAALSILKEAEICMALGQVYANLSDNVIITSMREGDTSSAGSISIGQTSISGDSFGQRNENIVYLASLGAKYEAMAEEKLGMLDQNSIRLVSTEFSPRLPRFRYPFSWA